MMENIVYFVIFASVGVTVEVVFTAIATFRKALRIPALKYIDH